MRTTLRHLPILAVVAAFAVGVFGPRDAQALLFVDELTTSQMTTNDGSAAPSTDDDASAAAEALGGERDMLLTLTVSSGLIDQDGVVGAGEVSYNSGTGERGTLLLSYDGPDGDATTIDTDGLGADDSGVDLTEGGVNTMFAFSAASDLGGDITITVWSDGGTNVASQTVSVPSGGSTFNFTIPFASFVGVDFTDVSALSILLDGTNNPATDITMSPLRATVPEPGSLTLLGAGLAGLGLARRRRRR